MTIRIVPARLGAHAGTAGSFILMEFEEFRPVTYLESETSCLFLEEPVEIAAYRDILARLDKSALDKGESKEVIAKVAIGFHPDREDHDDGS